MSSSSGSGSPDGCGRASRAPAGPRLRVAGLRASVRRCRRSVSQQPRPHRLAEVEDRQVERHQHDARRPRPAPRSRSARPASSARPPRPSPAARRSPRCASACRRAGRSPRRWPSSGPASRGTPRSRSWPATATSPCSTWVRTCSMPCSSTVLPGTGRITLSAYRIWVPLAVRMPRVRANLVTAYMRISGPKSGQVELRPGRSDSRPVLGLRPVDQHAIPDQRSATAGRAAGCR